MTIEIFLAIARTILITLIAIMAAAVLFRKTSLTERLLAMLILTIINLWELSR